MDVAHFSRHIGLIIQMALVTPPAVAWGQSASPPASVVRLDITNDGMLDVDVYAYRQGQRRHLGLVVAHQTATLTLPLSFTEDGEAQLYVHRIGERPDKDFLSNAARVRSYGHPVFHIDADVQMSSLAVFPES